MGAPVMFSMNGRRKLRRLLQQLLWPKVSVRHYGAEPLMGF